jgi:hypothetical protein
LQGFCFFISCIKYESYTLSYIVRVLLVFNLIICICKTSRFKLLITIQSKPNEILPSTPCLAAIFSIIHLSSCVMHKPLYLSVDYMWLLVVNGLRINDTRYLVYPLRFIARHIISG